MSMNCECDTVMRESYLDSSSQSVDTIICFFRRQTLESQ